jgi:hypothetical protein
LKLGIILGQFIWFFNLLFQVFSQPLMVGSLFPSYIVRQPVDFFKADAELSIQALVGDPSQPKVSEF